MKYEAGVLIKLLLQKKSVNFNKDVSSCAMVHLVHLDDETLSKERNKFYYVSITNDYVTDFT